MTPDEYTLENVVSYIDDVLNGMAVRPAMYGTPVSLEMEYLRLLEVKEIALGLRTMEDFLPVSRPDLIWNQWMVFCNQRFPGKSSIPLCFRQDWNSDDKLLKEFVKYLVEFRGTLHL